MTIQSAYKSDKAKVEALTSYDEFLNRWPVPYQTRVVKTRFGETHIIISGSTEAKPLVLLHGGAGNSTMWINNIAALSQEFQVFAIDIIGEPGKSYGARPKYKSDDHARWLKEVFSALEIKETALCGLSLGAMLAWKFALIYPESVSSLALLSSSSLAPAASKKRVVVMLQAILANILPIKFIAKNFLKYISATAAQWPSWAVKGFVIQYQSYKFNFDAIPIISDHELLQLPPQTLILLGQDELLFDPVATASRIISVAPSITLHMIPNARHTISTDQPDLVNEKLLKFFL